MKAIIKTLGELGSELVLAPERWLVGGKGIPLGDLVTVRRERAEPSAVVVDTTHARDGVLDLPAALRAGDVAKSSKQRALPGDLIVSRLRPYLRQIAFVHPRALELARGRALALSMEYVVLAPREDGAPIAYLLPFLLGEDAQRALAAAQEGGHHPRVHRESLLALPVPEAIVAGRAALSRRTLAALDAVYTAQIGYQALLGLSASPASRSGTRDRSRVRARQGR